MTIDLLEDDEKHKDLVLVFDGEIVGEVSSDGTIYTESYSLKSDEFKKEDFKVLSGTELKCNSVSEYAALLKRFKNGCESLSIGVTLDSLNGVSFLYSEEFDEIDFFQKWGSNITFWKFKDVTKQKIDLFIKP